VATATGFHSTAGGTPRTARRCTSSAMLLVFGPFYRS